MKSSKYIQLCTLSWRLRQSTASSFAASWTDRLRQKVLMYRNCCLWGLYHKAWSKLHILLVHVQKKQTSLHEKTNTLIRRSPGASVAPFNRMPVRPKYVPRYPGSRGRKYEAPTSGNRPMPHSGMAKTVLFTASTLYEHDGHVKSCRGISKAKKTDPSANMAQ